MPCSATRISSTWKPTKSCSKCLRRRRVCVKELKVDDGATVTSGQVLAILEEGAAAAPLQAVRAESSGGGREECWCAASSARCPGDGQAEDDGSAAKLSPSVRRMVEEKQLDPTQIAGSGRDGRITKSDVVNYWARSLGTASRVSRRQQ